MNYYKIKIELERRNIPFKDFCRQLDVSEQGLYQMIRNESMKVDMLERISHALNVPITYWFDAVQANRTESHPVEKSGTTFVSTKEIDMLTGMLNKVLKNMYSAN